MTTAIGTAASSRPLVTTSWDDGSRFDVRVAELLTRYGLLGTFYASTGPGGKRTIDEHGLTLIAQEHELANHGRTHTPFTALSAEEIRNELEWGERELAHFGRVARVVAPPGGKIDERVTRVVHELGYGLRTAPILGKARHYPGTIEPTFLFYPHKSTALVRSAGRRKALPAISLLLAWARGRDFRRRAISLLSTAAERFACVHVWGHADEVERLQLWEPLRGVLAAASELRLTPVTNSAALAAQAESADARG